ncbi:hypothetical protein D3C81_1883070 [compost metagenome]
MGATVMRIIMQDHRLRWDIITPLGRPVVPPVYMITARSSPLRRRSSIGAESAIRPSYESMPAGAAPSPAWISNGLCRARARMSSTSGKWWSSTIR